MKKSKVAKTKFIATVNENKISNLNKITQTFEKDGVSIDNVSEMFGIISGNSNASLDDLKLKYEPRGLTIEPDREVTI